MKKPDRIGKRRFGWNLETLIIVGLSVKITLAALFLFMMDDGRFSPFHVPTAQAQEAPKPAPPAAKPQAAPTAPATAPGNSPLPLDSGAEARTLAGQYQNLVDALKRRESDIDRREQRLVEREKALDILQGEMDKKLKESEATRVKLAELVKKQEDLVAQQKSLRDARIEHLVATYKSMKPQQAATLVNNLEEDVAVEILAVMPGRSAGQILAYVNPEKAARLTKAISERKIESQDESKDKKTPTLNRPSPFSLTMNPNLPRRPKGRRGFGPLRSPFHLIIQTHFRDSPNSHSRTPTGNAPSWRLPPRELDPSTKSGPFGPLGRMGGGVRTADARLSCGCSYAMKR